MGKRERKKGRCFHLLLRVPDAWNLVRSILEVVCRAKVFIKYFRLGRRATMHLTMLGLSLLVLARDLHLPVIYSSMWTADRYAPCLGPASHRCRASTDGSRPVMALRLEIIDKSWYWPRCGRRNRRCGDVCPHPRLGLLQISMPSRLVSSLWQLRLICFKILYFSYALPQLEFLAVVEAVEPT